MAFRSDSFMLWPSLWHWACLSGDITLDMTPIRAEILESALSDSDDIFVAIFDDPVTPHEEALEREAMRMADEGLLSEISPGQYRITAAGRSVLAAHNRTPIRKATDGATTLVRQAESNYARPLIITVAGGVIVTFLIFWLGLGD